MVLYLILAGRLIFLVGFFVEGTRCSRVAMTPAQTALPCGGGVFVEGQLFTRRPDACSDRLTFFGGVFVGVCCRGCIRF
jgi:hypothetical protein